MCLSVVVSYAVCRKMSAIVRSFFYELREVDHFPLLPGEMAGPSELIITDVYNSV